jgi:hypothetical protein
VKSSKQALAGVAAFAVGLYLTWRVASWLAWRQEGLDRDATVGSADCDDCELTVLLDQIGFVLVCFAAYILLVGTAWLVWRRRHSANDPDPRPGAEASA